MFDFEKLYAEAVGSRMLPGYALMAGNTHGEVLYSASKGVQSLKSGSTRPFQMDTICGIASMTKLMTAVAVLQCVEVGLLDLDKPVANLLPEVGKYGIIQDFDDARNEAITVPNATPITLRMLLSHTSGQEYDWLNPLLGKWRESRNEQPWTGETVEQKSTVPLVFEPGTSFAYGGGLDWAGKMIEKATEKTLEEFMAEKIWRPLGINDITFYPWRRADMKYRMATFSTLSETDEGPAEDKSEYDILMGGTDCLGGGGAFASAEGYFVFLQAVLRRDARILTDESWTELFKPQLDAKCKRALNGYLCSTPAHTQFLGMHVPPSIVKNWSFAGLICEEGQEGRMRKGSIFWGGVPCMQFYLDFEAGLCGVMAVQMLPPMSRSIMSLHEQFQRGIYERFAD